MRRANLDKALAKYWVRMQESPPKFTVEPGYGLRLAGTAAAGEELTEFHKYGPPLCLDLRGLRSLCQMHLEEE